MAGKCVAEALTVMRLALGYRERNPCLKRLWETDESPKPQDMPRILGTAFPQHQVVLASPFSEAIYKSLPDNVVYVGKAIPDDLYRDAYVWAFSYQGQKASHVVVGRPIVCEGMVLEEVIGVQIGQGTVAKNYQELEFLVQQQARESALDPPVDEKFYEVDDAYLDELQARVEMGVRFGTFEPLPEIEYVEETVDDTPLQPSRIVKSYWDGPQFMDVKAKYG